MFNIFRPRNSSLTHPSTDTSPAPGIVYSTAMGQFDIRSHYSRLLSEDTTKSMPIAAMESLSALCDASKATTIHELLSSIEIGSKALIASVPNSISLTAGCAMFTKFISAHTHDDPRDFGAFKKKLQENGHLFAQSAREARFKIAGLGVGMLRDGEVVMVHGYSRCAVGILKLAAERNVRFKVIVTETRPSCQGTKLAVELRALGVPVAVIDDNAVAYAMKKCRSVLIGAESIFADASIINVMGTHQIALAAKKYHRKVYVATETHKFVDIFPLDQFDIPIEQDVINFDPPAGFDGPMPQTELGFVDYTEPQFIDGFITEVGLLTPDQVAERIVAMRFQ
ncbi:uncharacterized protein H6S33_004765 [Morchella sextelata]|uniref:uncharacterized protein n=1 Tax=Morchella sextelata TaxID=1174677 RepID=UPI001D04E65E|nr:uncharacterized protein H6S33_004765 [Morchella sextelata]KAH0605543.1 hypothetical protein H6S33_004765 [Morchella sextelata]